MHSFLKTGKIDPNELKKPIKPPVKDNTPRLKVTPWVEK